ncbi:peptide ABC transporter substrate-binding protein [Leptospira kobayashii]|uniref:Peptide ABC transporter substrate-binding protein n=1 Tax=Leptospira kobayashii TaxID=1917830 RepID=A0ABN6KFB6_9LEPT|nr:ABC transporter substrate-binding protein [Leptospira kobayashii]BDA79777.1 peptide ABC transporter substrate-binding protein [Leptospira kobayashii]
MRTFSLIFLILSLTFCQKKTTTADVSLGFPSDPPSLDPLFATDLVSQKLSALLFGGLFQIQNAKPEMNWAENSKFWKEKKGIIWEIRLKSEPLGPKTEDVVFSIQRLLQENSPRGGDYKFIKEISAASEPNTIKFQLDDTVNEEEAKEKLSLPFASILSKKDFLERGEFHSFGKYRLVSWKKNESLELIKRDSNDTELPDTVRIRILPQSTTSLFLFRKGELDSFKLTDFLLSSPDAKSHNTIVKRGRSVQYVAINQNNPCFDKNFRHALNFAIPRGLIIEKLLENKADLLKGPIAIPFLSQLTKTKSDLTPEFYYDKNKAISLLKNSACFPGILNQTLELRMRGDDENQAKGRAIEQALKEIGLQIKLKGMEKAPLYKENGEGKGDLTLLTWYADYESVWNFLDPVFHGEKPGNGGNRAFYSNRDITKLLNDRKERNLPNALKIIKQIEEDAPWIFLWSIQENYLVSDKFIRYAGLSEFL